VRARGHPRRPRQGRHHAPLNPSGSRGQQVRRARPPPAGRRDSRRRAGRLRAARAPPSRDAVTDARRAAGGHRRRHRCSQQVNTPTPLCQPIPILARPAHLSHSRMSAAHAAARTRARPCPVRERAGPALSPAPVLRMLGVTVNSNPPAMLTRALWQWGLVHCGGGVPDGGGRPGSVGSYYYEVEVLDAWGDLRVGFAGTNLGTQCTLVGGDACSWSCRVSDGYIYHGCARAGRWRWW
jgi:hypothetical protein